MFLFILQIKTNDKDRPLEDVKILDTVVFVNPFAEAEKQVQQLRKEEEKESLETQKKEEKKADAEVNLVGMHNSDALLDWTIEIISTVASMPLFCERLKNHFVSLHSEQIDAQTALSIDDQKFNVSKLNPRYIYVT